MPKQKARFPAPGRPATAALARQVMVASAAPLPWPNILAAITNLLGMFFPCLLGPPTPEKLQRILSNPNRIQERRMDRALWRTWTEQGGTENGFFAFSHAVKSQCRLVTVPQVARLQAENRPAPRGTTDILRAKKGGKRK